MRILGLDVGEKNIGLAISDEMGWTAQALPTLRRNQKLKDLNDIAQIVSENKVEEVVIGMPINMDGSIGKKAQEIAGFLEELRGVVSVPIKVWDERMSSMQAERAMLEGDLSRKKRKKKIDQIAAQLILQNYLDARSTSG